jgi:dipeptidyl-peptidase-4
MIKYCLLIVAFVAASTTAIAQKNITVEDIYSGTFSTEGLQSLNSLKLAKNI